MMRNKRRNHRIFHRLMGVVTSIAMLTAGYPVTSAIYAAPQNNAATTAPAQVLPESLSDVFEISPDITPEITDEGYVVLDSTMFESQTVQAPEKTVYREPGWAVEDYDFVREEERLDIVYPEELPEPDPMPEPEIPERIVADDATEEYEADAPEEDGSEGHVDSSEEGGAADEAGDESYADATDVITSGDYQYTLTNDKASIYKYIGTAVDVTIPSKIDGHDVVAIGSSAFSGNLENVTIPEGVTELGNSSFYNCKKLETAVLPSSLTKIGSSAFLYCEKLNNISIPAGVTLIDSSAFQKCVALERIIIPGSVTKINSSAFADCTSLSEVTLQEGLKEVQYNAFAGCTALTGITIPASLEKCSNNAFKTIVSANIAPGMTTIPNSLFQYAEDLTTVTIPDSVTAIGSSAFQGCKKLESIDIPDGVVKINSSAFSNCIVLSGVVLPEGLKEIGSSAFSGCTALTEITIPASLEKCQSNAFQNSVVTAHIAEGMTTIPQDLFDYANKLTTVTIPDSVTVINSYAFRGCVELESVTLPQHVEKINNSAFSGCTLLSGVVLPEGLKEIGSSVFYNCPALTEITIPASLEKISSGAFSGVVSANFAPGREIIPENLFNNASNLTTVIIPDSVTEIGYSAFAYCSRLERVNLSSGLKKIGSSAFYSCRKLSAPALPEGLEEIGASAFAECPLITEITIPSSLKTAGNSSFKNAISMNFAEGMTTIPDSVARGASELTTVNIPSSVTSIGASAFYDCQKLQQINIPSGVTSIGANAFYNCKALMEIDFPENITEIKSETFRGCESLTTVIIPDSVTKIGSAAFYDCTGLVGIDLGEGLQYIESQVFSNCGSLTAITLPGTLVSIGSYAFRSCTLLESLEIPAGVNNIGSNAFLDSISSLSFQTGRTVIPDSACSGATNLVSVVLPEGITEIGASAFNSCENLQSINIPDGVKKIGYRAFYQCSSLTVILPDSVETIGNQAFYRCKIGGYCGDEAQWVVDLEGNALYIRGKGTFSPDGGNTWKKYKDDIKYIQVEQGITEIPDNCFSDLKETKGVVIGDSVTRIGKGSFQNLTGLERIELPKDLRRIDDNAFNGCTGLTTVIFTGDMPEIGDNAFPYKEFQAFYPESGQGYTDQMRYLLEYVEWTLWDDTLPTRDVVLVLDVSGSMSGKRIEALKKAVKGFADQLGGRITNTRISIVTFDSSARTILPFTTDIVRLFDGVDALTAGGGTTYLRAFDQTEKNLESSDADLKTLILFSDGEPGDNRNEIQQRAAAMRDKGYFIYTVGLSSSSSSVSILTGIAGGEQNYFEAEEVDELAEKFIEVSDNLGKKNTSRIVMEKDGKETDLRKTKASFAADSDESVNIKVYPVWGSSIPGKIRLTQGGRTIRENTNGIFADIKPGKIFKPVETVSVTLLDADNVPVSIIRTTLDIKASTKSRLDEKVDAFTLTVMQNKKTSNSRNDKYVASQGATVKVGTKTYITDKKGTVKIDAAAGNTNVTVSKQGFLDKTSTVKQLEATKKVYLQPANDKAPVINALWVDGHDVLTEKYGVDLLSKESITMKADVNWGSRPGKSIGLTQNGRVAKFNNDGTLTMVLSTMFDTRDKLYLVAEDTAGRQTKKALKIGTGEATAMPKGLSGLKFNFSDSLKVTLPDNIPIFGGTDIKAGLSSAVPVTISAENGKVYVAIGVDIAKMNYSSQKVFDESLAVDTGLKYDPYNGKVKYFAQQFKDCWNSKGDKLKKYSTLKNDVGDAIAKPKGNLGFNADFTMMGFAEGYYDSQGNMTWTDGGLIFMPSIGVSYSTPLPPPVSWIFVEVGLTASMQAQLNIRIQEAVKAFMPNGEISGKITLSGGAGVGANGLLDVGGGVAGSLKPDWKIYIDRDDYFKLTASLNIYVKGDLGPFLGGRYDFDPIAEAVWVEVPRYGSAGSYDGGTDEAGEGDGRANGTYALYSFLHDTSHYTLKDLSYITDGEATPDEISDTLSKENIYRESRVQLVNFDDGTMLAVWIDAGESDVNSIRLYYSFYNGTGWSTPAEVYSDGTFDMSPALKVIDGKAYLVWMNADGTIAPDATAEGTASMFDISVGEFDRTAGFSVATVSNNGLDALPALCGGRDGVNIVWRHSESNNWFGAKGDDSILSAVYKDGSLSGISRKYQRLNSVGWLDADYNGSLKIAYTMDTDGDINTPNDIRVYENGRRVTSVEAEESSPTYHDHVLYWINGGSVIHEEGEEQAVSNVDRYTLADTGEGLALVYSASNGLGSVLNISYMNEETGQWGTPVQMSEGTSYIGSLAACGDVEGMPAILTASRAVTGTFTSEEPYGNAKLSMISTAGSYDIAMGDLQYSADLFNPGNDMELSFDLTNKGTRTVTGTVIRVLDSGNNVLSTVQNTDIIVPGDTVTAKTYFRIPSGITGQNIKVTASIGTEAEPVPDANESDNIREAALSFEDLAIEDATRTDSEEEGKVFITASLVNYGYNVRNDVAVEFREDSPEGRLVETVSVNSIAPLQSEPVGIEIANAKYTTYYVVIRDSGDTFLGNDYDYTALLIEADDCIEVTKVESNKLEMELFDNAAGTCVASLYDKKGKYMGSTFSEVGANAGNVSLTFKGMQIAEGCRLKIFIIDSNLAPLCDPMSFEN